MMKRRDRDF